MPKLTTPLDHVKIAAPCPADWDQMFSFFRLDGYSIHSRQAWMERKSIPDAN